MTNQYPGTCRRCGLVVEPGEGWVAGKPGNWEFEHFACAPQVDHTKYRQVVGDLDAR